MRLISIFIISACLLAACSSSGPLAKHPDIVIHGFVSRESSGDTPVYEIRASEAQIMPDSRRVRLNHITFTVYAGGAEESVITSDHGIYNMNDKGIELYDRVSYHGRRYHIRFTAQSAVWNPVTYTVEARTDVEGVYRGVKFKGTGLALQPQRGTMTLENAQVAVGGLIGGAL